MTAIDWITLVLMNVVKTKSISERLAEDIESHSIDLLHKFYQDNLIARLQQAAIRLNLRAYLFLLFLYFSQKIWNIFNFLNICSTTVRCFERSPFTFFSSSLKGQFFFLLNGILLFL